MIIITVARKPVEGTISSNVLKYGCGGLNIDASRIRTEDNLNGGAYLEKGNRGVLPGDSRTGAALGMLAPGKTVGHSFEQPDGRWPANLILDGSEEVLAGFPETTSGAMNGVYHNTLMKGTPGQRDGRPVHLRQEASTGSAARFFKTVKE